jgi:hypothetical protein
MAAPKGNNNAEVWTIEEATELMNNALELSKDKEYDFIGEIAKELDQYKEIFSYLADKFESLKSIHKKIISNCEANCFYNGKKQNITPSLAIMNLKSNHGWTDRVDNTTQGEKVNQSVLSNESISKLIDKL